MELKLNICNAFCCTENFEINGITADEDDFGQGYDACPGSAPQYGCGNRVFKCIPATEKVLNKYHINTDEYNEICEQLEYKLSFGCCGWCV